MAGVQEEVRGTDVCVLGRDAKEINAGNMGSMAQWLLLVPSWQHSGCLSERGAFTCTPCLGMGWRCSVPHSIQAVFNVGSSTARPDLSIPGWSERTQLSGSLVC